MFPVVGTHEARVRNTASFFELQCHHKTGGNMIKRQVRMQDT